MTFRSVAEELRLIPPLRYRAAFKVFMIGFVVGLGLNVLFMYQGVKFIKHKYFQHAK